MNADQYLFTILRRETVDTSVAQAVLNTLRPIIMPWANQYLAGIAPRVIAKPNVEEMVALIATAAQAERMTLDQYREDLAHREKVRACYAALEAVSSTGRRNTTRWSAPAVVLEQFLH